MPTLYAKPTLATFGNGLKTAYEYDELNRSRLIETRKADNTSVFKQEYSYDANSNRTRMVEDNDRVITYDYDSLEQLTRVDYENIGAGPDITYRYDIYGNRTNMTTPFGNAVYNYAADSNELQEVVYNGRLSVRSAFDGNGSLVNETYTRLGRPDMEVAYGWDTRNRLSGITYARTGNRPAYMPALPDNMLSFEYDDFGNRIRKTVNGETTHYINDGLSVLNELDEAGRVQKTMVRGLETVAEIDADGVITFVHQDVLGSTVLLTNAAGAIVKRYEYDPFGLLTAESGATAETRYLFTGQEYDPESELYYYNARYYNPRLGRFISKDAMLGRDGDSLSRNGYTYVKNNPLKYVDPTGEEGEEKNVQEKWWQNQTFNNALDALDNAFTFILDIPTFGGVSRAKALSDKIDKEGLTTTNLALLYGNSLISTAAGALSALDAGVALGSIANRVAQQTATIYRVEGTPNTKVLIDSNGNIKVKAVSDCLYVNCGPVDTSLNFYAKKVEGGLPGAQLKAFDVNKTFVDQLRKEAVNQSKHPYFPNAPMRVDPSTGIDQFGLTRTQIQQLNDNIIQGSGRIINPF